MIASIVVPVYRGAAQASPAPPAPTVRIQSFSVIVPDYDEAKRWYTETLGFVAVRDQTFGKDERFVLVAPAGQADIGIVLQKARTAPNPAEPTMRHDYSDRIGKTVNVVLATSDVSAYADALRARGVSFTAPPRQMPWGAQATFTDLYGNSFVIVGPMTARPPHTGSTAAPGTPPPSLDR
jgi:predicted enzyme related to lactoylglutathione lyase